MVACYAVKWCSGEGVAEGVVVAVELLVLGSRKQGKGRDEVVSGSWMGLTLSLTSSSYELQGVWLT